MDIYLKLFEVLFPVFFIVGIGYFLGKKKSDVDTVFITNYSANFRCPSNIYICSYFLRHVKFDIFAEYFFYSIIALSSFAIVGVIFLIFMKKDYIRELPPFFLPNTGNMGIPMSLCLRYFRNGCRSSNFFFSFTSSFFTVNVFLASKKFDIFIILKSPSSYAVIIAVAFLYFDMEMPKFVLNTVMLLGYAMIVLILMSLGISLTQLKVFSLKNSLISSVGRVILGPVIGFLLIKIFDLSGYAAGVLLIQSSMPSAILTYLIASNVFTKRNS